MVELLGNIVPGSVTITLIYALVAWLVWRRWGAESVVIGEETAVTQVME